jgi:hypothetical protein
VTVGSLWADESRNVAENDSQLCIFTVDINGIFQREMTVHWAFTCL